MVKFAVVLLFIVILPECLASDSQSQMHMALGTKFLSEGKYNDALRELKRASELDTSNAGIENNLGLTYFALKKIDNAKQHFEKAITIDPRFMDAHNNIGVVLINLSLYKKAIKKFEEVLQSDYPHKEKPLTNIGTSYYLMGEYVKAIEFHRESLKKNRMFCKGYDNLAKSYMAIGNYNDAEKALLKCMDICSNFEISYYHMGVLYYLSKRYDEAVEKFREIVRRFPHGEFVDKSKRYLKYIE